MFRLAGIPIEYIFFTKCKIRFKISSSEFYRDWSNHIKNQIKDCTECLSETRGKGQHPRSRVKEMVPVQNQNRIEKNVDETSAHQTDHGDIHFTNSLKNLFKNQFPCKKYRK